MNLEKKCPVIAWLRVNGVPVEYIDTVTMKGLESIASCLGSPFNFELAWMPFVAIGNGLLLPSTEDEKLDNELYRKRGSVSSSSQRYIVEATFGTNEPGDCTIREIGILNRISGGVLGARWVLAEDILKTDEVRIACSVMAL